MRCPECRQGKIGLCRWKQKNGVWRYIYQCNEDFSIWADEFCRETAAGSDDFIAHEEIVDYEFLKDVDFEVSEDDYFGWEKQEHSEISCPYCRTSSLIHGITKQTKREIYECSRCRTIWIGSVLPEHISNYRKYQKDALRLPDDTEYDRGGLKLPVPEHKTKTDLLCPRCISHSENPIYTGTLSKYGKTVFLCEGCFYVWEDSVRRENAQWYGEYIRIEQIRLDIADLRKLLAAHPAEPLLSEKLKLANLLYGMVVVTLDDAREPMIAESVSLLEQVIQNLRYGQQQEIWDAVRAQYQEYASLFNRSITADKAAFFFRKLLTSYCRASDEMVEKGFFTYKRSLRQNPQESRRCIETMLHELDKMLAAAEQDCKENGTPDKLSDVCQEFIGYYEKIAAFIDVQQFADLSKQCLETVEALKIKSEAI